MQLHHLGTARCRYLELLSTSDHLSSQRTPSQFALPIAVPAEMTAWLVADKKPLGKMYIPFGASLIAAARADAAIRQNRRINFSNLLIVQLVSWFTVDLQPFCKGSKNFMKQVIFCASKFMWNIIT